MPKDGTAYVESVFGPALESVLRRYLYIDTIRILMKRWLPRRHIRRIKELNRGWRGVKQKSSICVAYPVALTLHQPTNDAITYLDEHAGDYRVSRFDTALDFVMPNRVMAAALQKALEKHITQPHRGRRELNTEEGYNDPDDLEQDEAQSQYWSVNGYTTRNIVVYSDRASKITGDPCCHIEFRTGRRMCREYGMEKLANFNSIDLAEVARRHSRLSFLDWEKWDQFLSDECSPTMQRYGYDRRTARRLHDRITARIVGVSPKELKDVPVQGWLDTKREWEFWRRPLEGVLYQSPVNVLLEGAERAYPLYDQEHDIPN